MGLDDQTVDEGRRFILRAGLLVPAYAIVQPLIPLFAQDTKKDIWADALKDTKARQKALDKVHGEEKGLKDAVSRYYAIYAEKVEGTTSSKLVWGDQQLKFYDSTAQSAFEKTLKEQAKVYAELKGGKEADAFKTLVAGAVDFAKHAKDADVWLDYSLWGNAKVTPIGFAPETFWTNEAYKYDADRRSRLVDYNGQKAKDIKNNVKICELWKGVVNDTGVNAIWISTNIGESAKKIYKSSLFCRPINTQSASILEGNRKVSDSYLFTLATEWEGSAEFQHLVKEHTAHLTDKIPKNYLQEGWGFTCLPWEGKIVKYDPELVKKYDFSKKAEEPPRKE